MNNKLLLVLNAVTLVCWCKIWLHFLCYSCATSLQITSSLSALYRERHTIRAWKKHKQLSLLSADEFETGAKKLQSHWTWRHINLLIIPNPWNTSPLGELWLGLQGKGRFIPLYCTVREKHKGSAHASTCWCMDSDGLKQDECLMPL